MRAWRLMTTMVWLLLLGLPLTAIAVELASAPVAWRTWSESVRLLSLAKNTALLVAGALAVSIPLGVVTALLLTRSDLPGQRAVRGLIVLCLFIPLPVLASAWQSALGAGGWLPMPSWRTVAPDDPDYSASGISWKPWAQGLPAAIWVHALAALPWVIWLSSRGFAWVESHLEEDALVNGGLRAALRHVTLPRAAPVIGAAALWVGVQTAGEITVTDMMQVRTFAEEVYTQFSRPDPPNPGETADNALARAVAVSAPPAVICALAIGLLYYIWEKRLPPLAESPRPFCLIRLGRWRWPAFMAFSLLLGLLIGIPVVSLIWKTGQVPPGDSWSRGVSRHALAWAWQTQGELVEISLIWSLAAGIVVTVLALMSCWLARDVHWPRGWMLATLALAALLPGPVVGIGLKAAINYLLDAEAHVAPDPFHWLRIALYDGPSHVPVLWASVIRFLPLAIAIVWPPVRFTPRELVEIAWTDGATAAQELRHVVAPGLVPALGRVTIAVAALSLGELSAGKLVETPGGETFAHEVFMQMHYGVGNHLAAMCLMLLGAVAVLVIAGGSVIRWYEGRQRRIEA